MGNGRYCYPLTINRHLIGVWTIVSASATDWVKGQPMIVINKPGGSATVAAKFVAASKPNGYTLLMAPPAALYFTAALRDNAPVDVARDFKHVCMLGEFKGAVFVHRDSPIQSLTELVTHAKNNPGKLRYSTTGRTSTWGIAALGFVTSAGIKAQDVPAKGGAKARALLIGKQVDFTVMGVHLYRGFENKLRPLGLLYPERDSAFKDIPSN